MKSIVQNKLSQCFHFWFQQKLLSKSKVTEEYDWRSSCKNKSDLISLTSELDYDLLPLQHLRRWAKTCHQFQTFVVYVWWEMSDDSDTWKRKHIKTSLLNLFSKRRDKNLREESWRSGWSILSWNTTHFPELKGDWGHPLLSFCSFPHLLMYFQPFPFSYYISHLSSLICFLNMLTGMWNVRHKSTRERFAWRFSARRTVLLSVLDNEIRIGCDGGWGGTLSSQKQNSMTLLLGYHKQTVQTLRFWATYRWHHRCEMRILCRITVINGKGSLSKSPPVTLPTVKHTSNWSHDPAQS